MDKQGWCSMHGVCRAQRRLQHQQPWTPPSSCSRLSVRALNSSKLAPTLLLASLQVQLHPLSVCVCVRVCVSVCAHCHMLTSADPCHTCLYPELEMLIAVSAAGWLAVQCLLSSFGGAGTAACTVSLPWQHSARRSRHVHVPSCACALL